MQTITRQQAREIDRRAVEEYGLPSIVLMENAGRGCADKLFQFGITGPVVVCCGPGNNGGDGFVIARHLDLRYATVKVAVFAPRERFTGDAATNLAVLERAGVPIEYFGHRVRDSELATYLARPGFIVDALLGTGFEGEVREPLASVIDVLNATRAPKIAIDLPSGFDADLGPLARSIIRARHTLTFVAPKVGFGMPGAEAFTGVVHTLDIGVPRRLIEETLQGSR